MKENQNPLDDLNTMPEEREALSRLPNELSTAIAPPPPCQCDMCQEAKNARKAEKTPKAVESGPIQPPPHPLRNLFGPNR